MFFFHKSDEKDQIRLVESKKLKIVDIILRRTKNLCVSRCMDGNTRDC